MHDRKTRTKRLSGSTF